MQTSPDVLWSDREVSRVAGHGAARFQGRPAMSKDGRRGNGGRISGDCAALSQETEQPQRAGEPSLQKPSGHRAAQGLRAAS